ncbi:MAG TPA: maleylpyruvate isomerase family mycothiol-dependent enzyme [Acidimicrobiales bacterium]|nr:maleylpyruvate isomerase family mycothiol-dependent enzyme [Acidimicrobiales bacterium]
MTTTDRRVLDDFTAEQTDLYQLLVELTDHAWAKPTPAAGWTVRDQVAHLAHTEELARDTATGGPGSLEAEIARYGGDGQAMIDAGVAHSRSMSPSELLDWWWSAAARNRETLAALDSSVRVPWGLGMGWRAFVTARLMEHWAHGLDIRHAVGRPGIDTDRLRHVAWIGTSALPYAFSVAGVSAPSNRTLRVEVTPPSEVKSGDQLWAFGPADATDRLTGPAGQWCRRAVQRATVAETPELMPNGPLAELALVHARAFL